MTQSGDIVILGGGVIGLNAAYYLAKDGLSVLLCERGELGKEASWAGAGILPPSNFDQARDPCDRLRALSGKLFPQLSADLREWTGIDNGFLRCGGIEFLSHADGADPHEWRGLGVTEKPLTEQEAIALEPALAPGLGNGMLLEDMAQLRNPRHLQALVAGCRASVKVSLREQTAAESLVIEGNRVKGVRTPNEVLAGDTFVIAAGAWSDRLLEPLGCRLRIEPVRGQIALLNPGRVLFRHILMWGAQYLVPRDDGRVLIGSTEERAGYDRTTTAAGIDNLLALGMRLVPALAGAALERTWAGLRPGSPDGLPFIGRVPGIDNLYVAAGHFRAGIQLSPGTALLLKQMILGQPLSLPIDAFRLDR
ncbi:MAG TPA: glycine oxidase ThiO [Gemmataceae bacterium]|nr:glycine oxidase ThiO [Gemmataceae bacterium]